MHYATQSTPMPTPKSAYKGTQAIARTISLISLFSDARPQWSLAELVEALDLNRTTVYRLLSVVEDAEWVVRDPQTDLYRLGSEMIALGGRAQRANHLRTVALPHLRELARTTGETASLEILSGREVVLIEEVAGQHVMSGAQAVGSRWPAHTTSTGKAILAYLPPETRPFWFDGSLDAYTPHTITTAAELQTQLAQVRQQGFASAAEELELGYTSVGAPIFDHKGAAVAAISIGGATVRLQEQLIRYGRQLRQTTDEISHQLGYRQSEK